MIDLSRFIPKVCRLHELHEVAYDTEYAETSPDRVLYYTYNDVYASEDDARIIKANSLRYDITIMPSDTLGFEYIKTAGHYHPEIDKKGTTYTEVYEVLEGTGHFIMQNRGKDGNVKDVYRVIASRGDKVIVPPWYGHVIINPSRKRLVTASWVYSGFTLEDEPYRRLGGAAYIELINGTLIPNPRYGKLPELRDIKPNNIRKAGLFKEKDMYSLVHDIDKLRFLKEPWDFEWLFNIVIR